MKKRLTTKPALDLVKIADIGTRLMKLRDQLAEIFPERESLLDQIIYALLTREHVLVFGPFGTGKSDLIHTLFECIKGSSMFSIGMSKFMTESSLVGVPDPKKVREEGKLVYRKEDGILSADLAEIDELFDSNAPLLRTLLGILNERQWKRGRQVEWADLLTAIASTNGIPWEEVKKSPELGALVDRFLFINRVDYLKEKVSRVRMYRKYCHGAVPDVSITLEELKLISGVVTDANQITDDEFFNVYDDIITAYRQTLDAKDVVSDRRACKLLQIAEANALLHGRFDVHYEDILAVRHGLCNGDPEKVSKFVAAAEPYINDAKQRQVQSLDEVQKKLLEKLEADIPAIPGNPSNTKLVELKRQLVALGKQIDDVKPQLPSTVDKKRDLLALIENRASEVQTLIDGK